MSQEELLGSDEVIRQRLDIIAKRLAEEFEGVHSPETVRAVLDESTHQLAGGGVGSYVTILAERFARERLTASAQAAGQLEKDVRQVVIVSLTGGGRAQIAAALLGQRVGEALQIHTAGSAETTTTAIDPNVRTAMQETGIDLADEFTRPLTADVLAAADVVITMGRSVEDFQIPEGVRHVDWRVGNPAGAGLDEVRRVRDDIDRRVEALAVELTPVPAAETPSS
jgi:protein-tyrosine-phosphatase